MSERQSPALAFVAQIWEHAQEATGHSWTRFNGALYQSVVLAIQAGLRFDAGDFATFCNDMRGGYWLHVGDGGSLGEGLYTVAVDATNLSACQSFEAWRGRPPFIYGGSRLRCGVQIDWTGQPRVLTSFAKDGQSITLCTYKAQPDNPCSECRRSLGPFERKVASRISVSVEECRTAERERVANVSLDNFLVDMRTAGLAIERSAAGAWSKKQRDTVAKWTRSRRYGGTEPPPKYLAAALKEGADA